MKQAGKAMVGASNGEEREEAGERKRERADEARASSTRPTMIADCALEGKRHGTGAKRDKENKRRRERKGWPR